MSKSERRSDAAQELAFLLDDLFRIPGTNLRVGLDPLLGLVPGAGDAVAALLSAYLVLAGVRRGLPKAVVGRMVFNIALDVAMGAIPVLGDLFDASWKANRKNARLLREYPTSAGKSAWSDWVWAGLLLAGLVILFLVLVVVSVQIWRALDLKVL